MGLAAKLGVVTALPCSQVGFLGAPSGLRRWGVSRMAPPQFLGPCARSRAPWEPAPAYAVLFVCGGLQNKIKQHLLCYTLIIERITLMG